MKPVTSADDVSWLMRRALLAAALMVGFYVFGLAIAVGLAFIPYLQYIAVERMNARIALFCWGAAVAVLWALIPRRDQFDAPGPRLERDQYPQLFAMIDDVAKATGQVPPAEVFLIGEVNAWVAQRGGVMGIGARRVMGLGLPLMQAVSHAELKAIVAHEFGHYQAGDVALGPWIYQTRAAIGRAIESMGDSFLATPFSWYGHHFLRLTHAVSRQQEFVADQVAVQVAGAPAAVSALKRISAAAPLFARYFQGEVTPVLNAGYLPPVASGFHAFLNAEPIKAIVPDLVRGAEDEGSSDVFDTHPSMRDRLAAIGLSERIDVGAPPEASASSLLGPLDEEAKRVLAVTFGNDRTSQLAPLDWEHVTDAVVVQNWRDVTDRFSFWLAEFTAETIPVGRDAFSRAGARLVNPGELLDADQRRMRAVQILYVAMATLLVDQGWQARTGPGLPVVLEKSPHTFSPREALRALAEDECTKDEWVRTCTQLGISGLPLAVRSDADKATDTPGFLVSGPPPIFDRALID